MALTKPLTMATALYTVAEVTEACINMAWTEAGVLVLEVIFQQPSLYLKSRTHERVDLSPDPSESFDHFRYCHLSDSLGCAC